MDRFEFYKESYQREWEKSDTLDNALNIPLGLVSASLAALIFFFVSFDYDFASLACRVAFFISIILAVVPIFIVVYFLARSYHDGFKGYDYKSLDYPAETDKY